MKQKDDDVVSEPEVTFEEILALEEQLEELKLKEQKL